MSVADDKVSIAISLSRCCHLLVGFLLVALFYLAPSFTPAHANHNNALDFDYYIERAGASYKIVVRWHPVTYLSPNNENPNSGGGCSTGHSVADGSNNAPRQFERLNPLNSLLPNRRVFYTTGAHVSFFRLHVMLGGRDTALGSINLNTGVGGGGSGRRGGNYRNTGSGWSNGYSPTHTNRFSYPNYTFFGGINQRSDSRSRSDGTGNARITPATVPTNLRDERVAINITLGLDRYPLRDFPRVTLHSDGTPIYAARQGGLNCRTTIRHRDLSSVNGNTDRKTNLPIGRGGVPAGRGITEIGRNLRTGTALAGVLSTYNLREGALTNSQRFFTPTKFIALLPPPQRPVPTGLTTVVGASGMRITWTRAATEGTPDFTSDGTGKFEGYRLTRTSDGGTPVVLFNDIPSPMAVPGGTDRMVGYTDTDIVASTRVRYSLRATNAWGIGNDINSGSVDIPADYQVAQPSIPAFLPPEPHTEAADTYSFAGSVSGQDAVVYTLRSSGVDTLLPYAYQWTSSDPSITIRNAKSLTAEFDSPVVAAESLVTFTLTATLGTATVTTNTMYRFTVPPPATPQNVRIVLDPDNDQNLILRWDESSGATGYQVQSASTGASGNSVGQTPLPPIIPDSP